MQLAAAPNNSSISSLVGPLSKDRPAHDAGHVPMTDLVNAGPPCRLIAKHLILHSRNIARRVDTGLEIIELWPAFQSEKTGSTPVGSAIKINDFCTSRHSALSTLTVNFPQASGIDAEIARYFPEFASGFFDLIRCLQGSLLCEAPMLSAPQSLAALRGILSQCGWPPQRMLGTYGGSPATAVV